MLLFLCHYTKNVEASSLTPTFIIEPKKTGRNANRISPVGCAPGRAAKGASPFVRTKQKTEQSAPFFVWYEAELRRDLRVEARASDMSKE